MHRRLLGAVISGASEQVSPVVEADVAISCFPLRPEYPTDHGRAPQAPGQLGVGVVEPR